MVKVKSGINLNKSGNNINLNKPSNNINLNKPSNINLDKPTQQLREKDEQPGNLRIPGFKEAPGGMEQIGDTGFYRTPDEPADPQDCERYPDSPWCGGNPFTFSPFSFEPAIVLTECDIGIRFDGSFGFVRLPPVGFVYRNPNCRQVDLEERRETPQEGNVPSLYLPNIPDNETVFVFTNWQNTTNQYELYNQLEYPFRLSRDKYRETSINTTSSFSWNTFYCPGENEHYVAPDNSYSLNIPHRIRGSGTASYNKSISVTKIDDRGSTPEVINDAYQISELIENNYFPLLSIAGTETRYEQNIIEGLVNGQGFSFSPSKLAPYYNRPGSDYYVYESIPTMGAIVWYGKWGKIVERLQKLNREHNITRSFQDEDIINNKFLSVSTTISIAKIIFSNCQTELSISPPPIPPEPPMTCCPDDLIRLLIQKIDRLSEVVGINEYPATVPESFISTQGGFLNQEMPIPNIQIASLTKFLEWYVKRFDELMGQWEIPIEVKDSDPTTPGDQGLGFKLPNMAEAIAEMFLLLLQTSINTETLLNMNTRTMIEVGQDKQQNFKAYMLMDAIADYLGFKYEEKKHKLPMLFDINKDDYAELLKESETEVVAAEFTDKHNFQETLHRLLEGAAITKSAHFRKLDVNGDMVKQIIDLIKNYSKINKQSNKDDDLDTFARDAEVGFTNQSGISNTTQPYGRDYSQRPRIREIGNTSDQES